MDGHVSCLAIAHPSDYPETFGTVKREGQRSWYVRDHTATTGADTEVYYRFVGHGAELPAQEDPR